MTIQYLQEYFKNIILEYCKNSYGRAKKRLLPAKLEKNRVFFCTLANEHLSIRFESKINPLRCTYGNVTGIEMGYLHLCYHVPQNKHSIVYLILMSKMFNVICTHYSPKTLGGVFILRSPLLLTVKL